jgi:hypothetical protein
MFDKHLLSFRVAGSYIPAPPARVQPNEDQSVARFYQPNFPMKDHKERIIVL